MDASATNNRLLQAIPMMLRCCLLGSSSVWSVREYKGVHVATMHLDPIVQMFLHQVQLDKWVYLSSWIDMPVVEDDLPANGVINWPMQSKIERMNTTGFGHTWVMLWMRWRTPYAFFVCPLPQKLKAQSLKTNSTWPVLPDLIASKNSWSKSPSHKNSTAFSKIISPAFPPLSGSPQALLSWCCEHQRWSTSCTSVKASTAASAWPQSMFQVVHWRMSQVIVHLTPWAGSAKHEHKVIWKWGHGRSKRVRVKREQ